MLSAPKRCEKVLLGVVPADDRDLNYDKFFEEGETAAAQGEEYNSHNTQRLDVEGMKALLMKLDFMQRVVRGEPVSLEH